MAVLLGAAELAATFRELGGPAQRRIARKAIPKGLRPITKAIKAQIPPKYKSLKQAIGQRFSKDKGGERKGLFSAKVGVGVGKKKRSKKRNRTGRPGVGAGIENAHWFVLGTGERQTGGKTAGRGKLKRRILTGNPVRSTGSMPPQIPDIVKHGFASAEAAALTAMTQATREAIAAEVLKAKK